MFLIFHFFFDLPEDIFRDSNEINISNTNIELLPQIYKVNSLELRNKPISEFPDIFSLKSLDKEDIR